MHATAAPVPGASSGARFFDVTALSRFRDTPALIAADKTVSYAELARRARDFGRSLGDERRLVAIEGANTPAAITSYIGALDAGHTVLLTAPGQPGAAIARRYGAAVHVRADGQGGTVVDRDFTVGADPDLHPRLALLLSTSGSTGSPKLVRLSHDNLQANAEAIAEYLRIESRDRAATTLPMHYCYGLSVIHSNLLRGASLILTDLSVVDECFWRLAESAGMTSFAGVPHTFELLERNGFAERDLPALRYVTQAGGRLAPDRVRRFAALGRRRGWDFFVMYGQTEATARMAYLPPALAESNAESIGVPVPGGEFTIDTTVTGGDRDAGVGELVYRGANVMLGYAECREHLALGRTVHELRTGDLARRNRAGMYEVTGRLNRFVKIFGLRVDLQRVESLLADRGLTVCCTGHDDRLMIGFERGVADARAVRRTAVDALGLAPGSVQTIEFDRLPVLPSGKPDHGAVLRAARTAVDPPKRVSPTRSRSRDHAIAPEARELTALFAAVLDVDEVSPEDSFAGLGGDSLSYVEMSVALEDALGHLPENWHVTPIGMLRPIDRTRRGRSIEQSVLIRAVAIVLIVGSHAGLFRIVGSAHVLVAVAGFNFARFLLNDRSRAERLRGIARATLRIVIPSVAWIAFAFAFLTDQYRPYDVLLLDSVLGPSHWTPQWHFWFVEALVYLLFMMAALIAVPAIDRVERRHSFTLPLFLLAWGLTLRFGLVDLGVTNTKPVLWLFALGWAAARARSVRQRLLVSAIALSAVPAFFGDPAREAVIGLGLMLLIWHRNLRVPRAVAATAAILAASSLYVYLVHWQVFRHLPEHPAAGVLASLAAGIVYWKIAARRADEAAVSITRRRDARRVIETNGRELGTASAVG